MEQYLVILMAKLAVAASLASILSRSTGFQSLLLREERTVVESVKLALGIAGFCVAGAATRLLTRSAFTDLSLEGSLIAGLLGGYISGLIAGILICLPSMFAGELLSMPLYAACGVLGGLARDLARDPEDIWRFSPFFDLSLWRLIRWPENRARYVYHLTLLAVIVAAELLRLMVRQLFEPKLIFTLYGTAKEVHFGWPMVAVFVVTIFSVTLPIKIWNSARNERLLDLKERLLAEARLTALSSQINPHFLFNTLNTVSSLIRTNPERARKVVYKLSNILRRLLRKSESTTSLREELAFIEDYLSIEIARFGEKLRFVRDVEPATLDCQVPSMVLQPIVENSVKHGLAGKVEGGTITVRSRIAAGRLVLEISDDGVGMDDAILESLFERGIGVNNVNERLKVIFGEKYRLQVSSTPGQGTRTEIELPAPGTSGNGALS
jgi:two-component system LytT family sensor kinase